jgi:hypothetical protein
MALIGAAAAVGALQACVAGNGREDVAVQRLLTRVCEKALECGCPVLQYDIDNQPLECGSWPPDDLGFDSLHDAGQAFDPACVEPWTSWVDELSCQAPAPPRYADLCPLYHGTLRVGEACEQSSLVDTDCHAGLFCIAGTCRDPLRTRFGGQDEPCDLDRRCDDGLGCVSSVCQRLPGPGEFCLEGYLCNAESRCGYDLCVALPGPGERCDSGDCQPGAFCSFDPVSGFSECRPSGDVGDPCGSQLPCGPGFACVAGQCQAAGEGVPGGSACALLDVL